MIKHIVVPKHNSFRVKSHDIPTANPVSCRRFAGAGFDHLHLPYPGPGSGRNRRIWVGQKRFDEMDWLKGKPTGNHRFVP